MPMLRPLLFAATVFAFLVPPPAIADHSIPDSVRIRLLGGLAPREIEMEAPRGGLQVTAGVQTVLRIAEGGLARLRVENDEVHVQAGSDLARGQSLSLSGIQGEAVVLRFGDIRRTYRGSFLFTVDDGALRIVNTVDLEEYVAAVVATEYALDDLEGTKAMAVVARTYAVRDAGRQDAPWDHEDDEGSQVYRGSGSVTQIARIAAEDTRGEVMTWQGEPIEAVYSSSSGGHTASNEDVWNSEPYPYLRGREDPWDRDAPQHEWTWNVDRQELDRLMERRFKVRPRSIDVEARSRDGRAESIRLDARGGDDVSVPAGVFRSAVVAAFGAQSLRSTLFEVQRNGDRYVFEGKGYGHGVGLSQWGAHGMSLAGKSYREILDFYYRDVRLERRDPGSKVWALAALRSELPAPNPPVPEAATAARPSTSMPTSEPAPTTAERLPEATRARVVTRPTGALPPVRAWGDHSGAEKRTQRPRVGW